MRMPRWNNRAGAWLGGDADTLYAFTDPVTGLIKVRPGRGGMGKVVHGGYGLTVAVATRAEAETLWQSPLHAGWKVA
jgi:hypothetical protein